MASFPAWLPPDSRPEAFPDTRTALADPDGLLAVGGDLSPPRLLYAYRHGIFPWYSDHQPILWWSPDPRCVLFPPRIRISRSLRRTLRRSLFELSSNTDFEGVIRGCAAPRPCSADTWITAEMRAAYLKLHQLGHAISIECWHEGSLAGGLYGVSMGQVFFGESMFSRVRDASKVALAHLCRLGYSLIDCQMPNAHLERLGATCIPRTRFERLLGQWCAVRRPAAEVLREARLVTGNGT